MKTNSLIQQRHRCIFFPKDRFTKVWNGVISLMLVYLTFILPFELAFDEEENAYFQVSEVVVSGVFFMDIVFHFNLAFRDHSGRFEVRRGRIARRYLCCWFFLDLISCFPFYLFIHLGKHSLFHTIKTSKLMKYFKIIRVLRFVKYTKHFFPASLRNRSRRKFISFKSNFERMMTHLFAVAIIAHVSACALYFLPMWASPERNWVTLRGLQHLDEHQKYLFSLHFMVETMITVGYGENPYT